MTAVAADLSDHGNLVASVFNFFSLPLVQSNPSLLWNSQSTKFGSSINIFPDRRSLTEVHNEIVQSHSQRRLGRFVGWEYWE